MKSREKGGYVGCKWECLRANCYAVQQRVADKMWQFYIVTPMLFFLHTKPYSAVPKSYATFLLRVEQIPLLIMLNKHVLSHLLNVFAVELPKRRVPHTQQSSSALLTDKVWLHSGRFIGQGKISYLSSITLFTQSPTSASNHFLQQPSGFLKR